MSERDNGGQVFPLPAEIDVPYDMGLTVRDWFAGHAMAAVLPMLDLASDRIVAATAFRIADAMIRERGK
jgi:hypothetical protein